MLLRNLKSWSFKSKSIILEPQGSFTLRFTCFPSHRLYSTQPDSIQ